MSVIRCLRSPDADCHELPNEGPGFRIDLLCDIGGRRTGVEEDEDGIKYCSAWEILEALEVAIACRF